MSHSQIRIPFNRPHLVGPEEAYVAEVVRSAALGEGAFTRQCARLLEQAFGSKKVLMTPSCTAALEMAALLCELQPGDEVVLPSYTFVSTANAFVLRGARPVFVDVREDTLNIDESQIDSALTSRTRAVVPVHYGGVGCEMDSILALARRRGLTVVEDAAQAVHAYYKGQALGAMGDLGTYSFHSTKNYVCGEGGALCINQEAMSERAEIIRDKGTNRQKFFRGEVDKYTWIEPGSSFIPAELACAFLQAQLEGRESILQKRLAIYARYHERLASLEQRDLLRRPRVPEHCAHNAHLYYILLRDGAERSRVMESLRRRGIGCAAHYVPLHLSPMGRRFGYEAGSLPVTESCSSRLLRLPLFADLSLGEVDQVCSAVEETLNRAPARAACS